RHAHIDLTHDVIELDEGSGDDGSVRSGTVLVIEDNVDFAAVLDDMVRCDPRTDFDVVHAGSLNEALALLARMPVVCTILDLALPDARGLEALTRLGHDAPSVPLVVLTGWANDSAALLALQEGAEDYLFKGTVSSRDLVRTVQFAIE